MPTAYIYNKKPGGKANTANFEARDLSRDGQELNAAIKAAGTGGSIGGGLAGAAVGAAAGTAVPVIGTAIGAGIGVAASALFGDPKRVLVHDILKDMIFAKWGKKRAEKSGKGIVLTAGQYPAEKVLRVVKDINTELARTTGDTYDPGEARKYNGRLKVSQTPPDLRTQSAEGNTLRGDEFLVAFQTPEPEAQVEAGLSTPGIFETLSDSPVVTVGAGLATIVGLFLTVTSQ